MKMYLANEEIEASPKPDKTVGSLQYKRKSSMWLCLYRLRNVFSNLLICIMKLGVNLLGFFLDFYSELFEFLGKCISDISFEYVEWYLSANANDFFRMIHVFYSVTAESYRKKRISMGWN